MNQANIMVIGVGPHARRIYIPILSELSRSMPVRLVGAVDLRSKKESVERYLLENDYSLKMLYFDLFDGTDGLPHDCVLALDSFVKEHDIRGVVISTEPLAHKMYAEWALTRGLHILMDKPVSARKSMSTNFSQAVALEKDFEDLLALYRENQGIRPTAFSINVQRRYEYGFERVKELIAEARKRFNVPVTSIQAMHADGTWMFPTEVLTQESHRHFDGYGKVAHSGYHLFDIVWQLYEAGLVQEKRPDHLEILSSPTLPSGLSVDLDENDYRNYFGMGYTPPDISEDEYRKLVKSYGEMDSFNIVRLLKDDENICNISINLLHSSFSRRAWATPHADRYKRNGRVKHQQFIIQQGPFQCIQIHNYQSKDLHDVDNSDEFDVGGNNHFDVFVFRNSGMFGSGKAFYRLSAKDLEEKERSSRLVVENAKARVIIEFINYMLGKLEKRDLKSNIETHAVAVKMMSGIYQSTVRLAEHQNPLIRMSL